MPDIVRRLGWSRSSTTPPIILLVRLFFLIVPLMLFLAEAEGIDIYATGGWGETIDASDLVSGAGSDLLDTYESAPNATAATISSCAGDTDNWRGDVRRADGTWHGDFTLYVKKTSDGTGTGSISGGLTYTAITTIDTQHFSGAGNRDNINLQYKLTGMSIHVSPANYSTSVIFTVVDT